MVSLQQAFPFSTGEPVVQVRAAVIIDMPNMMDSLARSGARMKVAELEKALQEVIQQEFSEEEKVKVVFETKRLYYDEHPDRVEDQKYNGFIKFLDDFKAVGFDLIPVPQFRYKRKTREEGYATTVNFREYKSRTDSMINMDVGRILTEKDFEVLIIFSGDSDYEFITHEAIKTGKHVILISHPKMIAHVFRGLARVVHVDTLSCI